MKNSKIFKHTTNLSLAFMLGAGISSPLVSQAQNNLMMNINNQDTKIVIGENQKHLGQHKVSFIININHLGFIQRLSYASGHWPLSAVIFDGNFADKNRLCPYFDLAGRPHSIQQIKKGDLRFLVTTTVKPQEISSVNNSGCLVTNTPKSSTITFK